MSLFVFSVLSHDWWTVYNNHGFRYFLLGRWGSIGVEVTPGHFFTPHKPEVPVVPFILHTEDGPGRTLDFSGRFRVRHRLLFLVPFFRIGTTNGLLFL